MTLSTNCGHLPEEEEIEEGEAKGLDTAYMYNHNQIYHCMDMKICFQINTYVATYYDVHMYVYVNTTCNLFHYHITVYLKITYGCYHYKTINKLIHDVNKSHKCNTVGHYFKKQNPP